MSGVEILKVVCAKSRAKRIRHRYYRYSLLPKVSIPSKVLLHVYRLIHVPIAYDDTYPRGSMCARVIYAYPTPSPVCLQIPLPGPSPPR